MSEYTPEDFRSAGFAVLPKYGLRAHKSAGDVYWQRDGIKRATNAEMAEAGWQPVVEAEDPEADGAISLDGLRAAWENAEVPTEGNPVRVGDALISSGRRGHLIRPAAAVEDGWAPPASYRVLHRAPKRNAWQELGDKLAAEMPGIEDEPRIEALAKALYCEHDVRVVGGDEA